MKEQTIPKDKRFVPIKTYCDMTGLSYPTVNHMCKTGQLKHITTEGGLRRIDTQDTAADNKVLLEKLDKTEKMLSALCRQLNTQV